MQPKNILNHCYAFLSLRNLLRKLVQPWILKSLFTELWKDASALTESFDTVYQQMISNNENVSKNHSSLSIIRPADTYINVSVTEKSDKTLASYILLENMLQELRVV